MAWPSNLKLKALIQVDHLVKQGISKRQAIRTISKKNGIAAGTLDRWLYPRNDGKNNGKTKSRIKTQEAAAKYLGVSQRVISYHVGRGNLKGDIDGRFSKTELDRWALEHGKRKDLGPVKKYAEQQAKYDAEFRKARAEEKSLVVSQLRGKLISIKEIEAAWAGRVDIVTSGLETLINRLPPILVSKTRRQIAKILQEEISRLREDYAKPGKYCPKIENGK